MLCIKPTSILIAHPRQQPKPEYVSLKHVTVEATIRSFAADVIIKQVFRNDEATPIEAVYCFPIEEQAAVYAFVAHIDDREITANLKEKQEAQQEYSDALRQGQGAYLLEQNEKSQDNFIINVGGLLPGKECHITISYVTELDLIQNGRKIRFVIPTTIAPRYNPNNGGISSPAETNSKYVQTSPYTIDFRCQVDKIGVASVSSPSHPIQVGFNHKDFYTVEFAQRNTHLDRDILLDIDLAENRSNTIVAIESGAIMASFTPTEDDCQRTMNNVGTMNEFIFVIDCSGSMRDENKIGLARQAMLLFLKSLPVNCKFNIIRFGSSHQSFFDKITAVYNKENVRKAEKYMKEMQADLGGTELLKPLEWLQQHMPEQGHARQVFLLTDGEISNVDQVIDLCRSMATSTRIFSFGLGNSPSRSLVKGLARATNGRFVFIPPNSSVDTYVGEQLQKALQLCITNTQVNWNLNIPVTSVPTKIPPVYVNDRVLVYALADDLTSRFDQNASVKFYVDQHPLGEANINRIPNVNNNGTIARLAAKALILELQHAKTPSKNITGSLQTRFQPSQQVLTTATTDEKDMTKKRIIELSLKYKILSPYTAFVGVEKRENGNNADMALREVPIQISADDQHLIIRNTNARRVIGCSAPLRNRMNEKSRSMRRSAASPTMYYDSVCYESSLMDYDSMCCELPSLDASDSLTNYYQPEMLVERSSMMCFPDMLSTSSSSARNPDETLPNDDHGVVRFLIDKQNFDGLWDLDSKTIEKLVGRSLSVFSSSYNHQVLISAIIIIILETRYSSLSVLWYGVVQKARKCLVNLLDNDTNRLESLFEHIRQHL
ncbi:unnamed protein product [Rotaria magnacalcarata]|uniref:Uncharacterized protein n=2 Tax=Rotaria magnacalcarata TaxID=392030 RepID=A0A816XN00_9BILA|nr:unnamed protein product [Rotaria magnacalcarata]CAF3857915.1 unnamed protein product [Rotaria magnacalcarata]